MPEDAQRITKSCNTSQSGTHTTRAPTQPIASFYQTFREERSLSDMENDDFMGLPCLCTWRFQHLFNSYAVRELPECGSGNIWNHNVLLSYWSPALPRLPHMKIISLSDEGTPLLIYHSVTES